MAYRKATEDAFIQGAICTVAGVGIENARTKDIAGRAGYTEATMYRMFPTKDALLRAAFLRIDRQLSELLTQSAYIRRPDNTPFELAFCAIWHRVYRYLVEHREETIFLIRYRYSSLYTDEVRQQREAYNGGMDKACAVLETVCAAPKGVSWRMMINGIFEMTLCYAEKLIRGRLADTDEAELGLWTLIRSLLPNE